MEELLLGVRNNQQCNIPQAGEVTRPVIGGGQIEEMVLRVYGLTVTSIQELNSYVDRNYHIKVHPEHSNQGIEEISDLGLVVKVMNSKDSQNLPFFDAQHALMSCLASNNIPSQVPLPNLKGTFYSLETMYPDKDKKSSPGEYMCELRTFLPGQIIQEVPYTPDLLRQNGKLVADVSNVLGRFANTYYKSTDPTFRLWTLTNIPTLTEYTFCLDETNRTLVEDIISTFNERVISRFDQLPKGHIHGDMNEQNILVQKKPDGDGYNISGILDYTDAEYTYPVFALAVNLAYMMIDSDHVDQLDTPGYILSGYLSVRSLTSTEWDVLVPCVAGRLAQSLTLGAHASSLDPTNTYVLTTAERGWPLLRRLWAESESSLITRWKTIIRSCDLCLLCDEEKTCRA